MDKRNLVIGAALLVGGILWMRSANAGTVQADATNTLAAGGASSGGGGSSGMSGLSSLLGNLLAAPAPSSVTHDVSSPSVASVASEPAPASTASAPAPAPAPAPVVTGQSTITDPWGYGGGYNGILV